MGRDGFNANLVLTGIHLQLINGRCHNIICRFLKPAPRSSLEPFKKLPKASLLQETTKVSTSPRGSSGGGSTETAIRALAGEVFMGLESSEGLGQPENLFNLLEFCSVFSVRRLQGKVKQARTLQGAFATPGHLVSLKIFECLPTFL